MSSSGISWAISLQTDNHASTPPLKKFLQAGCPSCRPTNSIKALKALTLKALILRYIHCYLEFGVVKTVRVSDELQQQQQQQPFNGRLKSGTTRVGRYQQKHSPAHTHPGQRTSFITFLHLQQSTACDELRCTLLCRASVGTLCTLYTRLLLLLLFLHGLFFLSVVVSTYFLLGRIPRTA